MQKYIKISKVESGQSLVELAFTVLLLLIMVAGIVDLGRLAFYYIAMRDAAQEGAVYGSINPTYCEQIVNRVASTLVDADTVEISVFMNGVECASASASSDACTGKEIRVEVEDTDFPITMPFLGSFVGGQTVRLNARISGTIIRPGCQ
jgi:Flp pilus assembly protein TadG